MFCVDCGVHFGSPTRVFSKQRGWHTLTLCRGCRADMAADGDKTESYAEWDEHRADERADRELSGR